MIFLVLMGLVLISTLSRGSTIKGVISGFLGILVSLVGYHLVTGAERFTFGSLYLREGIPVVPLFVGLFALPEMFALAATGGTIAKAQIGRVKGIKDMMGGIKELFAHSRLNVFSSVIGYIIGVIPGIGGMVASWVSYGQAKQTSRHPERFGTGTPEGIIAPESANNASAGGSVLTTLALGIPGSSGCVLLLGAFLILGIIPGPEMLTTRLPLSLSLLLVIGVAGVIAAVICLLATPYLARIAGVPGHILVPLVITVVVAGVFVSQELFNDLIVLFVFGVIGWAMKQFGYNPATFVLGFVLGSLFEKYLFLSLSAWGPLFFVRPICLVLIVITIVLMCFTPITKRMSRVGAD
jgi:putative tricarboxylic transport membrane protein